MISTIPAKTILSGYQKDNRWFGMHYNMNIYKGCCHGCIYCDSRSDCYRVTDFDRVRAKENALRIIRDDLQRKTRTGVVATGSMSDPYNPFERELQLTRHALELLSAFGFGVGIATKSPLITRDIDVLTEISQRAPVLCKITVTAADDALSQKIEPHVAPSSARLDAVARLSAAGLFTGLLLMPVLPFITDSESNIRTLVRLAAESGARFIYASFGVTLRSNQRQYFYDRLDELFPGLRARYVRTYGERYQYASPHARALWDIFAAECRANGILYRMSDIIRAYQAPYSDPQLRLF